MSAPRCPHDRQLRLLHLQPRPVPGRARRRRRRAAQRRDHARRGRGARARRRSSSRPARARRARRASRCRVIQRFAGRIPILGVCLGHQAIGAAFGGDDRARAAHHARQDVAHPPRRRAASSAGCPIPFDATRYHSLVIDPATLPADLERVGVDRRGRDHGRAPPRRARVEGVQFHPESILTLEGKQLLANFLGRLPGARRRERRDACATPSRASPTGATSPRPEHGGGRSRRSSAGEATPAQIGGLLRRAAHEGRDGRRARRARRARCARTRSRCAGAPAGASTPAAPAATAPARFNVSTAAALVVAARRRAGRQARQPRGLGPRRRRRRPRGARRARSSCRRRRWPRCLARRRHRVPASRRASTRRCATRRPPRRELGVRTIFNLLGPLTNPAGVRRQVVGVFDARAGSSRSREALARARRGARLVVHGAGGLDELALAARRVGRRGGGGARVRRLHACGRRTRASRRRRAPRCAVDVGGGGGGAHPRASSRASPGRRATSCCLNAAAALVVAGAAPDLRAGRGARPRARSTPARRRGVLERLVALHARRRRAEAAAMILDDILAHKRERGRRAPARDAARGAARRARSTHAPRRGFRAALARRRAAGGDRRAQARVAVARRDPRRLRPAGASRAATRRRARRRSRCSPTSASSSGALEHLAAVRGAVDAAAACARTSSSTRTRSRRRALRAPTPSC